MAKTDDDAWALEQFGVPPNAKTMTGSVFGYRIMDLVSQTHTFTGHWRGQLSSHFPPTEKPIWSHPDVSLAATVVDYVWHEDENTAQHGSNSIMGGCLGVSALQCVCGFYAYYRAERLKEKFPSQSVLAIIEGYGSVTLHEIGFRAEKARVRGFVALHGNDVEHLVLNKYHNSVRYYRGCCPPNGFVQKLARDWGVAYYASLAEASHAIKTPAETPRFSKYQAF